MARIPSGQEDLEWAREKLKTAITADELRQAQAIVMPLDFGMSIEQTAQVIGRSPSLTCKLRNKNRRLKNGEIAPKKSKKELRNRAVIDLKNEAAILDRALINSTSDGIVVMPSLKLSIEKELGKTVHISTIYKMLNRHGWRKLAPDTQHPKGNPKERDEWKKTRQKLGGNYSGFSE
jgi:transposase